MKFLTVLFLFLFVVICGCTIEEDNSSLPPSVVATPEPEPPAPSQYTLTVTAGEGGSVSTEGGTFDEGTEVTITATPDEGYEFIGWEGSDSESNSLSLNISSNTTIRALFAELTVQFVLDISAGEGGYVSNEGGIYDQGTEVTITAVANQGYEFVTWQGIESSEETIIIFVESNQSIQAIFREINLSDNLNFENLSSKINDECTLVFNHNNYKFFTNHGQPYLQNKQIIFRLNHHDFSSWTDSNNYLIFWFNASNSIDLIQVYKNLNLIRSFEVENNIDEQLDNLTSFLDNDSFYSETKFISEGDDIIEDGIYFFSGYEKRIGINETQDRFNCEGYGVASVTNHLNEKGREYFKVIDGNVVGRTLIYNSELGQNFRVWSLSDWYYTDIFTNNSRSILKLEKIEVDNYTLNNLNLSNTLKLVENNEIEGYKTNRILTKVSSEELGITMIDSYEGIGFYIDEVYSRIDFDDPLTYLDAFIKDAERHGVDLSDLNKNNFSFTIIPDTEWVLEAAAYASSICNDSQVEITFKESVWINGKTPYKTSIPDAVKTMWHEFGHDILNLDHVCLGDHIMSGRHQDPKIIYSTSDCEEEYITVYGMDWDNQDPRKNFQRAVDDMFSGFEQIIFDCTSGKKRIIF